jgi:hypothetical protein
MRIKGFQRICFIIYSGVIDKYLDQNRLKIILEKIKEVLKDENVHPNLIILILFSIRIFLLRLSKEILDSLLKSIWPSILFLLEKMILSKKLQKKDDKKKIIIAALKLIELISCKDIEEFNLHRWAFLFECKLNRLRRSS